MKTFSDLIILLIIAIHLYVVYMEMFAWNTLGRKAFKHLPSEVFPKTRTMAGNQGLYNGFLVAGLVWSLWIEDPEWSRKVAYFFLSCVFVAGVYGAYTVKKTIFYIQSLPALIGLATAYLR